MTTIAAIQGKSYALVGTDSRISTLDESGGICQVTTLSTGASKIAQNGKYLLGAAGDMRAINILHHAFQPPAPSFSTGGARLDRFITQKFVPALRECFESTGYALPDSNDKKSHIAEHSSTILVVVNNTIYIIDGDYSWTSDRSGIYAIGSGSSYALGALYSITGGKELPLAKAKTAINKALTIASKFDPSTGSPFQTFVQGQ